MLKQTINLQMDRLITDQDQLSWVQYEVASTLKNHVMIFIHAPSVPNGSRDDQGDHSHTDKEVWVNDGYVTFDSDLEFVEWINTEPRIEAVFAGHTHQDYIWVDVDVSDMQGPESLPNPKDSHTLYFSERPFYIETGSSCKEYS